MSSEIEMGDSDEREKDSPNEARRFFQIRESWKQLVLNEDRVMVERATLFVVVNSILAGGYALTLQITGSNWLRFLLSLAGLFFTLCWWYIAERGRKEVDFFWQKGLEAEDQLDENDRIFGPVKAYRKKYFWFWKLKSRTVLSRVLPLGWIVIWVVLLLKFEVS